ncbi:diguanylate cyclase (GGDEF)-like protein/PAS domain S-box-containing protein [Paucibacter oligotrophus]|uniref:Diguanylate cyclase (GGDEF)-like protein/PAS domain S-box-containing protein n=1 Tax=Roseateles oligotrophus TaxID=1769250 RepID=A0A840L240_9BURK|nr:sensor domain-containing diguanylate cyclase [Roseateles oligotrophus]MBB4841966.1 diguanylate cyclase (GGDEF)-like protein/PAS domain S-box-containing protein [Roseateles oligotrophus]
MDANDTAATRNYRHSLHGKFTLILLGTASLLSLLAALLGFRLAYQKAQESAQLTLDAVATAIEKTVAVGVYADDRVLLKELVDGVARDPNAARVWVQNSRGEVLAGSAAKPGAEAAALAEPAPSLRVEKALRSPFDSSEALGLLVVQGDAVRISAQALQQARWLGAALACLITVLALVLNFVVLRMLSRPMTGLARKLVQLEVGSSQRLQLERRHRQDEVGTVIRAANRLLAATETALSTERRLHAEIAAMEAQYRQIFDHTSAGIFVLSAQGRLINGNPTVMRVIGSDYAQLSALRGEDFIHKVFADPAHVHQMIADSAALGQTMSADLALRSADAEPRWVHCLISVQAHGAETADPMVEGVIYDVTQRKSQESAASHQAEHDALTGLKNRVGITHALDRLLLQAKDGGHALTLFFIDLDGFKRVNDELGHQAGDEVLIECGRRLSALARRGSDLVGRLGGDEMVMVLEKVAADSPYAQQLAEQALQAIQQPIALNGGGWARVGASIGVASYPCHASHRTALLNAADAAMYEVKRLGKNGIRVAPPLAPSGQ